MLLKHWLLPLIAAACMLYCSNYYKNVKWNVIWQGLYFTEGIYIGLRAIIFGDQKEINAEQRMFTANELKVYTNLENGLYLSILGEVFNVSKGAKFYEPGASYHVFTGRDASSLFITGEFEATELCDDVSTFTPEQIKAIHKWTQFYKKNYIYKGRLVGRYYNNDGSPTEELYMVQAKLRRAAEKELEEEQLTKMFPPCNIEWKPEMGTRLWCSHKSGGIERNWIGVPRILFEPPDSQQQRCACVQIDSKIYVENKNRLKEYNGCAETSTECIIN